MDTFVSWLDRPFRPGRVARPVRRGTGSITIRYKGSLSGSAIKALIVLLFVAVMSGVIGERTNPDLDATEVTSAAGPAASAR